MSEQLNDERAAFLAWHNDRRSSIRNAWTAWQARAALSTHHAAPAGGASMDDLTIAQAIADDLGRPCFQEDVHYVAKVRAALTTAARATEPAGGVTYTEVDEALLSVDDFIARCNGDDRGSCEAVNILRRAITAARAAEPDMVTLPRDVLEGMEWYCPTSNTSFSCPSCGNMKQWGHAEGCDLAAALAASPPTGTSKEGGE